MTRTSTEERAGAAGPVPAANSDPAGRGGKSEGADDGWAWQGRRAIEKTRGAAWPRRLATVLLAAWLPGGVAASALAAGSGHWVPFTITVAALATALLAAWHVLGSRSREDAWGTRDGIVLRAGPAGFTTAFGFTVTRVPLNVSADPWNMLSALSGLRHVRVSAVAGRNLMPRHECTRGSGSWFADVEAGRDVDGPEAGLSWHLLVSERHPWWTSKARALARARATRQLVDNALAGYYRHHGFAPAGAEGMALLGGLP